MLIVINMRSMLNTLMWSTIFSLDRDKEDAPSCKTGSFLAYFHVNEKPIG